MVQFVSFFSFFFVGGVFISKKKKRPLIFINNYFVFTLVLRVKFPSLNSLKPQACTKHYVCYLLLFLFVILCFHRHRSNYPNNKATTKEGRGAVMCVIRSLQSQIGGFPCPLAPAVPRLACLLSNDVSAHSMCFRVLFLLFKDRVFHSHTL